MKKVQQPKYKHIPQRSCVACHATRAKRELVRLVRLATGEVVVDELGKQNGRGAYLCRQRACWQLALKNQTLSHALHASLTPEALVALRDYAATLPESLESA